MKLLDPRLSNDLDEVHTRLGRLAIKLGGAVKVCGPDLIPALLAEMKRRKGPKAMKEAKRRRELRRLSHMERTDA